ncbi:HRDC domain-containing protein [filamentous cyanobacterium LEGE 11480]|uniref:HRDC domain-containing protein n=1 Tax=Romeriopsis navalis LEGE 11480 TaxID=2777977 RepID=A0A928Z553_9CYAN|nr:HRDC domain-containing protein [Romeriopsis navalis]MBE9032449.1 HRDC domain-containing protein [Romeriopsis navalis LEGE 11480]
MVQPPRVSQPDAHQYIETAEQLDQFIQDNQNITWLGFDTEFIHEKRFYPQLCLIQVITELGMYILDPLVLPKLDPFLALIENPEILKITHAGENDYRILNSLYGTYPQNLFDTQIAAGFLTHTYPIGFQKLVESEFDVTLNKSFSVTDWQARPMRPQQITYALNDVLYLPELWQRMTAQLKQLDRLHWCQEEVAKFTTTEYYAGDTQLDLFKRTLNTQLTPQERIFLVRLMDWRLEEAKRRNVTQDMVLPKKTMMMVAKGIAQGQSHLRQNRLISDKLIQSYSKLWNQLFKTDMTDDEQALFDQMPQWQEDTPEQVISSEFLYLLVRDRCFKAGMAHTIVLSKSAFRNQNQSLNSGWRKELLGDSLIGWIQSQQQVVFEVQDDCCVVKFMD